MRVCTALPGPYVCFATLPLICEKRTQYYRSLLHAIARDLIQYQFSQGKHIALICSTRHQNIDQS